MNKSQRKEMQKAYIQIEEALEVIRNIGYDERDKYDNLPEGLQATEMGEGMSEAADNIEEAADGIEEAMELIYEYTS